jgi:hypothetical protein
MSVRLQHPVPVVIERLSRETTEMDPEYREPIQGPEFLPAVTVPGQVRWGTGQGLITERLGPSLYSDGNVVFLTADLRAAGVALKVGDKLSQFGEGGNAVLSEVFIARIEPFAHYPRAGGAAAWKAYFEDRRPSES